MWVMLMWLCPVLAVLGLNLESPRSRGSYLDFLEQL